MAKEKELSAAAAAMGRKGGPARAKALSAKRRREIAQAGGRASALKAASGKKGRDEGKK
jgi:hypothetical protein